MNILEMLMICTTAQIKNQVGDRRLIVLVLFESYTFATYHIRGKCVRAMMLTVIDSDPQNTIISK